MKYSVLEYDGKTYYMIARFVCKYNAEYMCSVLNARHETPRYMVYDVADMPENVVDQIEDVEKRTEFNIHVPDTQEHEFFVTKLQNLTMLERYIEAYGNTIRSKTSLRKI